MRSSLKSTLKVFGLATLALTLAACNKSNGGGGNGTASNAGSTASGTGSTLVYQQSADIPTLDPGTTYDTGSSQAVENMYETLVSYKGGSLNEMEPVLATEWKDSNGGKTYHFTLRPDVKFHTGNPFTCADAEYTFRRNLVTNTADSGNWFLAESLLGTGANANSDKGVTWAKITAAVACDGETLVFNLPKADPAFLRKLAYIGQAIVDSKHAKEVGEWDGTEATWKDAVGKDLTGSPLAQNPSGTGAYKLLKKDATNTAFTAFDGYWGGKPNIQNVIIMKVPEQAARLQAFLKGDTDFVESGGRTIIESQLKGKPGVAVLDDLPDTSAAGLTMNQNIKGGQLGSGKLDGKGIPADFFSDIHVRRAFVAAFDTDDYIKQVLKGKGKPRNFLLPDSFPGYDATLEPAKFSLDTARSEFQKAWGGQVWQNGFTLNVTYRANAKSSQTMMEMLKKNIESINPKFKVNIIGKEWSQIIKSGNAGSEAMMVTAWSPDYADPDNFVHTFYSSKGYYHPRNNFADAEIDGWIDEARTTTDTARRNELYAKVARRAQDEALYIVMPAGTGVFAYRDAVKGISAETYNPLSGFVAGTQWKNLSK